MITKDAKQHNFAETPVKACVMEMAELMCVELQY
jgi:hypothetical protein